jgi:hypothetical protein
VIQQRNATRQGLGRLRAAIELSGGGAQAPPPAGPTCPAHALWLGQASLARPLFVGRTRARSSAGACRPDDPPLGCRAPETWGD